MRAHAQVRAGEFAQQVGALLWGVGALIHTHSVLIVSGWWKDWVEPVVAKLPVPWALGGVLDLLIWTLAGPVLVAVACGLRFIGGLMSGRKVAGAHAGRIAFLEWLRYELYALAAGVAFAFLTGAMIREEVFPSVGILLIGLVVCGALFVVGTEAGRRGETLMGKVRDESARMAHPAGLPAHTRPTYLGVEEEGGDARGG